VEQPYERIPQSGENNQAFHFGTRVVRKSGSNADPLEFVRKWDPDLSKQTRCAVATHNWSIKTPV
jgi:hypothetical protein